MRRMLIVCSLLLAAATACGDDEVTTTEVTITEAAPPPSSAAPASSAAAPSTAAGSTAEPTTAQVPAATETAATAETPTTDEDPIDATETAETTVEPVEPATAELVSADELEALRPRAEEMPPGFTLNEDGSGLQAWEDFAAGERESYLSVVREAGWVGSYRTSYAKGSDEAVEIGTTALRDAAGTKAVFDTGVAEFEERIGLGSSGEAIELANVGDEARGYAFATTADGSRFGGWAVLWRQGNVLGAVFVGSIIEEGEPPDEEYRPYAAGLANVTAQRIAETLGG